MKRQEINLGSYYWTEWGASVYITEALAATDEETSVMRFLDGQSVPVDYRRILGEARPQDVAAAKKPWWRFW